MEMQQVNASGQSGTPEQQKNIEEEKKKLENDLNEGKISQAEYFKKMQELTGSMPNPAPMPLPMHSPMPTPPMPLPQLPPAGMQPVMPGQAPIKPITPVTPQQAGPQEEVPPIGQALAVSSEDVEVVECYKCGGLITVTTKQRPVIIACPTCGTKGEVEASEPESIPEQAAVPKPTDAKELDDGEIFKFGGESKDKEQKPTGPTFGSTLDEDLAMEDVKAPAPQQPSLKASSAPTPPVSAAPGLGVQPTPNTGQPLTPSKEKKPE